MSSAVEANREAPQIFPSASELAAELLAQLRSLSAEALAARGSFHVALSGGSLPEILANAILAPADSQGHRAPRLDVSQWHWWFADERCVRREDPDSNYAEAAKKLFAFLPSIDAAHMHAIDESKCTEPAQAAAAYEAELHRVLPEGALDAVLLGMGPDGHCCSLFPGHALLDHSSSLIAPITDSPKPPPCRITFTYPLLGRARASIFVITGAGKAEALKTVMQQRNSKAEPQSSEFKAFLPSSRVRSQRMMFLVDKAAAEKLAIDARL